VGASGGKKEGVVRRTGACPLDPAPRNLTFYQKEGKKLVRRLSCV